MEENKSAQDASVPDCGVDWCGVVQLQTCHLTFVLPGILISLITLLYREPFRNRAKFVLATTTVNRDSNPLAATAKFAMPTQLDNPKEYQDIFHWAETQKDGTIPSFGTRKNDPYDVRDTY